MSVQDALDQVDRMRPWINDKAGCCNHIVLDDLNLETSNVEFCLGYAQRAGHQQCMVLAEMLMELSEEEREEVANFFV